MKIFPRLQHYADGLAILKDWLGGDHLPVETPVAQARADICRDCKRNVSSVYLSETIAGEIKRQAGLKNHLELTVQGEDALHTCDVCDCCIQLMVWCPDELFVKNYARVEAGLYPVFCWKRQLLLDAPGDSPAMDRGIDKPKNL
jgi:hypothetical protein